MILKEDLKEISYGGFGNILQKLTVSIKSYCEEKSVAFDLIVPILRSGAFTGMHIASKLKIKNILPVQYKYEYLPKETIVKKFEFPELLFKLPELPNILICDSNTVFGAIAILAITDVKDKYPNSKIYFASANLDQSVSEIDNVIKIFYGELSNEKRELTKEEADKKGITNDVIIFPWENLEEQWEEINTSQTQESGSLNSLGVKSEI